MLNLFKRFKNNTKENVNALTDMLSKKDLWCEPNIILCAFEIATDFGKVLGENGWMSCGAPESLLNNPKEQIILSFEILHTFLEDKKAQEKFSEKYPKIAKTIIDNNFYNALLRCVQYIELFIPDENAYHSVKFAKFLKDNKEVPNDFLLKHGDIINKNNELILKKTAELINYFNSKGFFINNELFYS